MRKSNCLSCNHDFDCCGGRSNEVGTIDDDDENCLISFSFLLRILPISSSLNLVISLYFVPNSCLTIRSCDFVKTVSVSAASYSCCMSITHSSHKIVSLCHFQSAGKSIGLFAHYSGDQCVITDTEMGNPYGWLQTWSRICASEFQRVEGGRFTIWIFLFLFRAKLNIVSFPCYNPIIFKVIAPVFGAVVVLMILVEFCCDICCWSLFRSLFLSGAEISQAFTFVLCKKDVS